MHLNMSFSGAIPHKLTQQIGIEEWQLEILFFRFYQLSIICAISFW